MRLISLACAALAVAAVPAGAQVTGELRTVTPYGNLASEGTSKDFQSWPANTALPQATTSTIGAHAGNAFADTLVSWNVWSGNILTCDVSEQGGGNAGSGPLLAGTTASPSATGAQQGPHELRLVIRGSPGLRGKVETWASGTVRTGSLVLLSLDVGDDSSIDFAVAVTGDNDYDRRQWDRSLDQNGELRVRIVTSARAALASGDTIYKTGISVRFTPGVFCEIGGYGPQCGARLSGYDELGGGARKITLQLSQAAPSAPAVLVLGLTTTQIGLPGTSCRLLTDPLVLLPVTTDSYGMAQQALTAPLGPLAANAQHVVLAPGPLLNSSNGVAITCR